MRICSSGCARARALNMDETGWRTAGQRRALWGVFTERHAFFHVAPDRHEDHAKRLLADTKAIVTSDRWWAYAHLPLGAPPAVLGAPRSATSPPTPKGLAAEKEFGEHGLELCERVFWAWEIFQHTHDRRELQRTIRQLQRELQADHPRLRRASERATSTAAAWRATS